MDVKPLVDSIRFSNTPSISFEFFPPKSEETFSHLQDASKVLFQTEPNFVSVTYGAMGSNQTSSLRVVEDFAPRVKTVAHLTCIGSTNQGITSLLSTYERMGVAGLLALRGDIPKDTETPPFSDFEHAIDLVRLAKAETNLEIGVAAFPEKHPESVDLAEDVQVLKQKQDAGATFAITQMFFDLQSYIRLVKDARVAGVTIPILPGIMPISNAKQVLRMADMSGAKLPIQLLDALSKSESEAEAKRIGMAFTRDLSKELVSEGAPGIHIYTLNSPVATMELLESLR